jgi:hypothetical protein
MQRQGFRHMEEGAAIADTARDTTMSSVFPEAAYLVEREKAGLGTASRAAAGGAAAGRATPGRRTVKLRDPGSPTEAKLWRHKGRPGWDGQKEQTGRTLWAGHPENVRNDTLNDFKITLRQSES